VCILTAVEVKVKLTRCRVL